MLLLDHLTVIAPTLSEGVTHVQDCLGIEVPYGGKHPEMGTHNHVIRLGDLAYLEIVSIDPEAEVPSGPRWFGFSDPAAVWADWEAGRRLRGWVAHTDNLDELLTRHGDLFGGQVRISRAGLYSQFSLLADGRLPADGALPSVIDRGGRGQPMERMEDHGINLLRFTLTHPSPDEISALYETVGIENAPTIIQGDEMRYSALIQTPHGPKTLF